MVSSVKIEVIALLINILLIIFHYDKQNKDDEFIPKEFLKEAAKKEELDFRNHALNLRPQPSDERLEKIEKYMLQK